MRPNMTSQCSRDRCKFIFRMVRSFNYPLKPTKKQEAILELYLWRCREVYNACLQQRKEAWKNKGVNRTKYDQQKELAELRQGNPDFGRIPATVLRSALFKLHKAYESFFRRVKKGAERPGFPRFKNRDRFKSFGLQGVVSVKEDRVNIPKLGYVKFHKYREIQGIVKDAVIKKTAKGWAISIQCDLGPAPTKSLPTDTVSLDLGLKTFCTLSTGEKVPNPRFFKKAQNLLAKRQQVLARKKRGSKSRAKAKLLVVKAHEHIANQRKDHARKLAKSLFSKYNVVIYEKLNIKGMTEGSSLSKSINDAAWRQFIQCLENKAEEAGFHAIGVNPKNTTQRCSQCQRLPSEKLTLRDRLYKCEHCGHAQDRDHNAALNIKALGLSALESLHRKDGAPNAEPEGVLV